MDTTILRIIIAVIGVIVVLGIYLWDYFRRRKTQLATSSKADASIDYPTESGAWVDVDQSQADSDLADLDLLDLDPLAGHSATLDEGERLSIHPTQAADAISHPSISTKEAIARTPVEVSAAPDTDIIQFSLVPKHTTNFTGDDLLQALTGVGLEYGENGIFHRYLGEKDSREPIFSVTSLVEPGTFPIDKMSSFECPGITLFLQTDMVADPLEAFDDLTDIGHQLVFRLFGKLLNAKRQEVTMDEMIEPIRKALKTKTDTS